MLKHLTAIAFLAASTHAMAQTDMTLDGLAKKEPAAFSQMVKGHTLPAWIKSGGTGSPARTVKLGAEVYQVFSVCSPTTAQRSASPCCGRKNPERCPGFIPPLTKKPPRRH